MKKRINLTIDKEIYQNFKKYCEKRGMKVSSKIELYMKKELNEYDS